MPGQLHTLLQHSTGCVARMGRVVHARTAARSCWEEEDCDTSPDCYPEQEEVGSRPTVRDEDVLRMMRMLNDPMKITMQDLLAVSYSTVEISRMFDC